MSHVFLIASVVAEASAQEIAAATELRKDLEHLAESNVWHALLHLHVQPLSSQTRSLVDSRNFFLAADGKRNPLGEIEAAVRELLSASKERRDAFRCRFPARAEFLLRELEQAPMDLSECVALNDWLQRFPNPKLSLIFAGSYVRNPASLFGHTFLRIDTSAHENPLLAQTISYSASAQEPPGLVFALKGLTGSYRARYRLSSYALHRREYRDIEDRELWEYPLDYAEDEVKTVLLHLWELKDAEFDYFFIDENCSYNLLSLLEVARPDLRLTAELPFYTVPLDLVRLLLVNVGLREQAIFREAPSASIRQRSQRLSSEDRVLLDTLVDPKQELSSRFLQAHTEEKQVEVLDLFLDYLEYKLGYRAEISKREEEAYLLRSTLALPYQQKTFAARGPELPHSSGRVALALGVERSESFAGLEFRFLYHDKLDPPFGFPPGSELEFLKFELRKENSSRGLAMQEATVLRMRATPLFEPLLQTPSWEIALGGKRREFAKSVTSFVFETYGRIGVTHEFASGVRASVLSGALLQGSRSFTGSFAFAANAVLDLYLPLGPLPAVEFRASGSRLLSGRDGSMHQLSLSTAAA